MREKLQLRKVNAMTTQIDDRLLKIFQDGILVDVDVRCWTGAKMLTPEDLGLEEKDVAEAYHLGKKMLVPDEVIAAFRKVESQARVLVERNSHPFPFGSARFVPKRKFPEVLAKLKECQTQYNALIQDLVLNYGKYREAMLPIYKEAAETAWINQTPSQETFGIDRDIEAEKKAFVDQFLARIAAFYPPVESIASKFDLSWSIYNIAVPSLDTSDGNQVALDETERQAIAEDYQKQVHDKIGSFVEDVVKTMRSETVEICNHIAQSIVSGKVINSRTIGSLRNFIDRFSGLNFVGDSQIEDALSKLRTEFLDVHEDLAENEDLKGQLKERLSEIAKVAESITDVNSVTGQYRRKISWTPGT